MKCRNSSLRNIFMDRDIMVKTGHHPVVTQDDKNQQHYTKNNNHLRAWL